MCGIWFCLGDICTANLNTYINKLKARGPEETRIVSLPHGGTFGFNRLALNGLSTAGMQPMSYNNIHWMCNGEIYNWKELASKYNISTSSGSDCEVLGELYLHSRDSLTHYFQLLDGVYATVIVDLERDIAIIGRDPYGVRPLFVGDNKYFASELKALHPLCKDIKPFLPGSYRVYNLTTLECLENTQYIQIPFLKNPEYNTIDAAARALRCALEASVKKRLLCERPMAALLSGGLDSSLIASIVQKNLISLGLKPLKTFCIGLAESTDIVYARKVADFIGSEHTEIIMTEDEFFDAIPHVIKDIESYDTTTVRASVGNWLVSKYIKEHTDCKVVFNGDGSDEIFGSYLYFYNAPNDYMYEQEVCRLLKDIHYFDVLRSDRSISSHGLEPRTPFLDRQFVQVALSIDTSLRRPIKGAYPEKYILRRAFDDGLTLPSEVLWRTKEAFSDGVSSMQRSWSTIIQEKVESIISSETMLSSAIKYQYCTPKTKEMYWYRTLFEQYYGSTNESCIPYFWMPRWCPEASDPSARVLDIYTKN